MSELLQTPSQLVTHRPVFIIGDFIGYHLNGFKEGAIATIAISALPICCLLNPLVKKNAEFIDFISDAVNVVSVAIHTRLVGKWPGSED
jgi:hypothetical protein